MAFDPINPGNAQYGRLVRITDIGTITGPNQTIDFLAGGVQTINQNGAVAYDAVNMLPGESYSIAVIITGAVGATRLMTFDANWKWLSPKPAAVGSGVTGMLLLMNKGATAADVIASWQVLS